MHLRRKPAFYRRPDSPIPARTFLPVHLNRHPDCDYEPIRRCGTAWTARRRGSRQLVVVQEVTHARLADFSHFAGVAHVNVARQLGIYHVKPLAYLAYEYVDLDVLEALPLSQEEISAVVSQVSASDSELTGCGLLMGKRSCRQSTTSASGSSHSVSVPSASQLTVSSRSVHTTVGSIICVVVRLRYGPVPDWSFEPTADVAIREANDEYLAADLGTLMRTMEPNDRRWTRHALGFLGELGSGHLPRRVSSRCYDRPTGKGWLTMI